MKKWLSKNCTCYLKLQNNPIHAYPATGDEVVYMGIDKSYQVNPVTGTTQNPGQFTTTDIIKSTQQARTDLAIPPEWKSNITHVQEYRIQAGTQVQESTVGSQIGGDGTVYPGGGNQIEILNQHGNRIQNDVLIPVGNPRPIPKN